MNDDNYLSNKFNSLKIDVPIDNTPINIRKRSNEEMEDIYGSTISEYKRRVIDNQQYFTYEKPKPLMVEPVKPLMVEHIKPLMVEPVKPLMVETNRI